MKEPVIPPRCAQPCKSEPPGGLGALTGCCLWKSPWSQALSSNMAWARPERDIPPNTDFQPCPVVLGIEDSRKLFPFVLANLTTMNHILLINTMLIHTSWFIQSQTRFMCLEIWRWFAPEKSLSMENQSWFMESMHELVTFTFKISRKGQRSRASNTTAILLPTEVNMGPPLHTPCLASPFPFPCSLPF